MTTGGIESFAAVWLVVVPLEAALSASRRVVAFASALALSCAALLIALGHFDLLPAPEPNAALRGVLMAFGVASATLYAAGLAFGAESLARTSVSLLYVEEDRYRLLARNMSDVISRHSRNGAVQFISPAAEAMLGTPVARLAGHGLFDRVHVADRPAYLTALSDAARGGEARSVEFRLRRDARLAARAFPPISSGSRCAAGRSSRPRAGGRGRRRDARRHRPQDAGAGARTGAHRRRTGGCRPRPASSPP